MVESGVVESGSGGNHVTLIDDLLLNSGYNQRVLEKIKKKKKIKETTIRRLQR